MAFRVVVVAAFLALASAGMDANYMNMMQMMMQQMGGNGGGMAGGNAGHQNNNQGGGQQQAGCNPAANGGAGGCQIPQGVDVGEYLKQQMEAQQFETQKMAEKMKAQFEGIMANVTIRKHRYAMSVMTEFTSMCACARESMNIYQTLFVESAKALGMTDVVDMSVNILPYEAKSSKQARELIFAGMLNTLCTSLGNFMTFAQEVENNIPTFQNNPVTVPSTGK